MIVLCSTNSQWSTVGANNHSEIRKGSIRGRYRKQPSTQQSLAELGKQQTTRETSWRNWYVGFQKEKKGEDKDKGKGTVMLAYEYW